MGKTFLIYVFKFLMVVSPLPMFLCCAENQIRHAPNIIIFIADDVSADDIGVYGNLAVVTPVIDSLADRGILFHNAFLTTSSCSPSRASIISGRYPHNTGAPELHMPLPAEVKTIAGQLKKAGYFAGASGKWHLGESAKKDFDVVLDQEIGLGGEDRWTELIEKIPANQPYFLWMASIDAHRNWGENEFEGATDMTSAKLPPYVVRDSLTKNDFRQYYDEITRFDFYIGQSLKKLKERDLLKNSVVIILADNGRPFPRDKTRMYDSGLRTPLVFYSTDGTFPKGKQSNALVSAIDLAPTISSICGLTPLDSYQGIDFSMVLKNPDKRHRNFVFGEHNWHDYRAYERMVRSEDFLYIENGIPDVRMSSAADVHSGDSFQSLVQNLQNGALDSIQATNFSIPRLLIELYNVKRDPHQLTNLINNEKFTSVKIDLQSKLREWKRITYDTKPDSLSVDRYEFFTAKSLNPDRSFLDIDRGEIPGAAMNASKIESKDSILQ